VSSVQDDSGNCFNNLQLRWKTLCAHRDTDLYWSLADDSPSCKDSGIISEWLLLLLVELNIPTLPGVIWTGHSLRRGGASAEDAISASSAVIMTWGFWKSLASALFYIDVAVRPSSEALFFFGHLLSRFLLMETKIVRQTVQPLLRPSMTRVIALLWVNYVFSFATMACAILISLRQSEIAARRIRQSRHRCLHYCLHDLGLVEVSCFSVPLHRCFCAAVY
jgi:hypothetical protein